ncbi:MAG: UDP-N-acetylmuramoyl-tripeptide--D-alanyl-D-alanine ligase [Defluviitaleaceae bacterium]|nr:UDP-N-acetylmuramoyl-tripeptide--D-alanyl-D-alanine ligase [Defluviitaleaceae bacterium]
MRLSIQEVLTACKGQLIGGDINNDAIITSICIDSRKAQPGALFVPIKGENVDGHSYITDAMTKGAVCALTEREGAGSGLRIHVKSVRRALMDIAAYYRRLHNIKVVAITGSAGKTTTKDMIAYVLARKFKTKKTMGNFNNDIGLPLSIFQLEPEDEVLVLEMGMNHGGEIHELSQTGAPDIAVITNIGDAHIENFANREGILHAKLEILDGLAEGGTAIFNGNDPLLTGHIARGKAEKFKLLYPDSSNIKSMDENSIVGGPAHFVINGQDIHVNISMPGGHIVMNALLAATVGIEMGLKPEEIKQGFEEFTPPGGRLGVMEFGGMTLINDVYNANPASMQEAIKVVLNQDGRKVCILGGMNELGHVSKDRHKELGTFAAEYGVNMLVTIGKMAWWINEGFYDTIRKRQAEKGRVGNQPLLDENAERLFDIPKRTTSYRGGGQNIVPELGAILRISAEKEEDIPQTALHFDTVEGFLSEWRNILRKGDIVLVKASRFMAFENLISGLGAKV